MYHELVIFSWTRPLLKCIAICMATEVGVIVFLRGTIYLVGGMHSSLHMHGVEVVALAILSWLFFFRFC